MARSCFISSSPLCTCLSPIDCFGDHLLGCSHGPMRIHRHDALVDILYNALSQDHPGVFKEQCASYNDGLCPEVISSTLTFSMVVLPILMSPYAVLLSLLIFPHLLLVLGWLLQLERLCLICIFSIIYILCMYSARTSIAHCDTSLVIQFAMNSP